MVAPFFPVGDAVDPHVPDLDVDTIPAPVRLVRDGRASRCAPAWPELDLFDVPEHHTRADDSAGMSVQGFVRGKGPKRVRPDGRTARPRIGAGLCQVFAPRTRDPGGRSPKLLGVDFNVRIVDVAAGGP